MNRRRNPLLLALALFLAVALSLGYAHQQHLFFFADQSQQTTKNTVTVTIPASEATPETTPTTTIEPTQQQTIAPSPTATPDPNGFSNYQKNGSHESAQCGKNVKVSADNSDLQKNIGGGTLCQPNAIYNGIAINLFLPKGQCGIIAGTDLYLQYPNGGGGSFASQWVAELDCNTSYSDGYLVYAVNIDAGEVYISSSPDQALAELHSMMKRQPITQQNVDVEVSVQADCEKYTEYTCSTLPPNHA